MKYRILEKDGYFYPQCRRFCFLPWCGFVEDEPYGYGAEVMFSFRTLDGAKRWLANHIENKHVEPVEESTIIHPYP